MKLVVVSDTHGQHERLGELSGDVLIHCGDFSLGADTEAETLRSLDAWFARQRFRLILCVGGNHDFLVQDLRRRGEQVFRHAVCLQDESIMFDGVRFHGAPWVPELNGWAHYRAERELANAWQKIPAGVDVLVTHTPPGTYSTAIRPEEPVAARSCGCAWKRSSQSSTASATSMRAPAWPSSAPRLLSTRRW